MFILDTFQTYLIVCYFRLGRLEAIDFQKIIIGKEGTEERKNKCRITVFTKVSENITAKGGKMMKNLSFSLLRKCFSG
jgi:hypothetical protein